MVLPWLSLQGIKQYKNLSISNAKSIIAINKGINVEVIKANKKVNNFNTHFRFARAYSPPKHNTLKHTVCINLTGTQKLTSDLILELRTP